MKKISLKFLAFLLLSVVITGCFGLGQNNDPENTESASPKDSIQQTEETVDGTTSMEKGSGDVPVQPEEDESLASLAVYNLADQWERARESILNIHDIPDPHHNQYELEQFTLHRDGKLYRLWGDLTSDHVQITGYVRMDDGQIDRLYILGRQTKNFADEDVERLQPLYELLIAVSNPSLSDQERSDIMHDLYLDGADAETLIEQSADDQNTLTVGDVRYDVVFIGSSEGSTYALSATLADDCTEGFALSPCRKD